MDMSLSKLQKTVKDSECFLMLQFMGLQRVGHNLETEQQQQIIFLSGYAILHCSSSVYRF